jgi:hypothetical protein
MIRNALSVCATLTVILLAACGGDNKSSEERAKEAQRAIQEGAQKEKQLYEGMQKQAEALEKKVEEQKAKN